MALSTPWRYGTPRKIGTVWHGDPGSFAVDPSEMDNLRALLAKAMNEWGNVLIEEISAAADKMSGKLSESITVYQSASYVRGGTSDEVINIQITDDPKVQQEAPFPAFMGASHAKGGGTPHTGPAGRVYGAIEEVFRPESHHLFTNGLDNALPKITDIVQRILGSGSSDGSDGNSDIINQGSFFANLGRSGNFDPHGSWVANVSGPGSSRGKVYDKKSISAGKVYST